MPATADAPVSLQGRSVPEPAIRNGHRYKYGGKCITLKRAQFAAAKLQTRLCLTRRRACRAYLGETAATDGSPARLRAATSLAAEAIPVLCVFLGNAAPEDTWPQTGHNLPVQQ